jgi:hypothetical protein
MPRYKLRTLLILLAVGPPIICACMKFGEIAAWISRFLATEVYYGGCIGPPLPNPMA